MNFQFVAVLSFIFFSLTFSGCTNCNRTTARLESSKIPASVEGRTLSGAMTLGTGAFSDLKGYTFKTSLLSGKRFRTTNTSNAVESEGTYTYEILDENTAQLKLTDGSGLHQNEQIEVKLKFTSPQAGTYEARLLSGKTGEQSGTFELE